MLIGVVPVFNEEENIIQVLNKLKKQLDYLIVINDGSFDKTSLLISDWLKSKENIHYISLKINKGMSCALLHGFQFIVGEYKKGKFSREDVIVTIDADGQHEPNHINSIYNYFNDKELDVLIAERDFSNYPNYRIIGNRLLSLVASFLGGFKFNDIECGFKLLKLIFVDELLNYYIGYRYSCAGEIGITASLLGYRLDNQYKIHTPYLRKGRTNIIDFFIDLIFYFLIFLKIKFNRISTSRPKNLLLQDNLYS